jgi:dsRNA-specific ribonuclease
VAVGEGLSKQEAEQEAAKSGLAKKGWWTNMTIGVEF